MLGDHLPWLNETGIDMLNRVLAPRPQAAVPVDLFESDQDLPRVWINRGKADILVGLFNWLDRRAYLRLDLADLALDGTPLDFWTDEPVQRLPESMPPRSCLALRFPIRA